MPFGFCGKLKFNDVNCITAKLCYSNIRVDFGEASEFHILSTLF